MTPQEHDWLQRLFAVCCKDCQDKMFKVWVELFDDIKGGKQ